MQVFQAILVSSTDRQRPGKTEDLIIVDLGVGGSSPPGGTTKINNLWVLRRRLQTASANVVPIRLT